ncbi:MAG: iron ABC transporter permease [Oscillospiraceae bacterium]|jgi:iron complex transport system permease protein|nr:iron ABC transporter permease [Oscillospiraceae bacterium]
MRSKSEVTEHNTSGAKKPLPLWIVLCTLGLTLLLMAIGALSLGRYQIIAPWQTVQILFSKIPGVDLGLPQTLVDVVFKIRLPRVIAALLIGGALSLAGASYQGMFKNPLVSPDLLGVSSGACVGASFAILAGLGSYLTQAFAFAGGIITVALTLLIPRILKRDSTIILVLSGVIVGGFMSSIIGITKYVADTETQLPELVFWTMGSIAKVTVTSLNTTAWIMIAAGIILIAMRWRINLLSLEDKTAKMLGVNIKFERTLAIVAATLLTATAVCLSGTIGWVGLVIPHITRMIAGSDNNRLLPASALVSGCFMLIIDTVARTLTNGEIPLSILTGIVGAPFFIFSLAKERKFE